MRPVRWLPLVALAAVLPSASPLTASSQPLPPRDVAQVYTQVCAACHGMGLEGGKARSMLDDTWTFGGDDASLAATIRDGRAAAGMPAFKGLLTEPEIRAMVYYLRETSARLRAGGSRGVATPDGSVLASRDHRFRLEVVAEGLETPWGMAFLPDGRLLVSERSGSVRAVTPGQPLPAPVRGTPVPWVKQDGGLLDLAIAPDYPTSGWIYLAYSEPGRVPQTSTTKVVRGKIRDGAWVDEQTIHQSPPALYVTDNTHFGLRFLFDRTGEHLFFAIGDRGVMPDAQTLANANGKIHRVRPDGSVPPDNPFASQPGAIGSIWTLGNRNPQGLAWHPETGDLWSSEHGPRGGDELNVIEKGKNYGWPNVTWGINYDGTPITDKTSAPGLESPIVYWTPSVAPSGIVFYTGDRFPRWSNDLFVAMLAGGELRRVRTKGRTVVEQETIFKGYGRVRHVIVGPDGLLYVALNDPGRIVRLVPE
jgi:glucose/arabinose dehydrogenase/cytochrome c5